jgi:hypothetical protein
MKGWLMLLHMDCASLMNGIGLSISRMILWWTKKITVLLALKKPGYYNFIILRHDG